MKKVLVLFITAVLSANAYASDIPEAGTEAAKESRAVSAVNSPSSESGSAAASLPVVNADKKPEPETSMEESAGEGGAEARSSAVSANGTAAATEAEALSETEAAPADESLSGQDALDGQLDADQKRPEKDYAGVENGRTKTLTVTATKTEHELREIPMTVNLITAEDIKNSPSSSVSEILAAVSGVTIEDNGAAGAMKVKIRGEASKRTLVIIDGVRQNEHAPSTGALPILISPSDIERIEVIKGPSSVLYGSDAMGGVVNIITKKSADKPFSLTQRVIYDSSSQRYDHYVGASGSHKGFFYVAGYDTIKSDLRDTPAGKLVGTDYKRENYMGKLGYKWDKGELSLGTQHHYNDANSRVGINNPPNVTPMDFHRHSYDTQFVLKDITAHFVKFNINAAQQEIRRETSSFLRKTDAYTVSPQTDWVFGDHYFIAGGQYNNDDFKNTQLSNGKVREAGLWDASVFIQDEWSIMEKFSLTLGARQSWYHSSSGSKSKDLNKLVGSAGAVYLLNDGISLRAQFSQGFKTPSIYETMMGSTMLIVNPDLKPEESNKFDLGAVITAGGIKLDAALFYTKADNYIAWRIVAPMQVRPENINKAETVGAEFGLSCDIRSFTPYVSATYIDRTYWNAPGSAVKKTNKTGIAPFFGFAGVRWEKNIAEFTVFSDLKAIWAGAADYESSSGKITRDDAWHTFNIQLGLQKAQYFFTLDINNICDEKYIKAESSPNFYEPGAHVILSAGFNF